MNFRIEGLDPAPFANLFDLSAEELTERRIVSLIAADDTFPCRVSLNHAAKGDRVLLLNHEHQPADTPFRARHAIYVARGSREQGVYVNEVPPVMAARLLSLRAFNAENMMVHADVVDGSEARPLMESMLGRADTSYLHVHFAKWGCFAGVVKSF